jgi:hypothetical protein
MAFQDGPGDQRVEPRFESMNDPGAVFRPGPDQPESNLRGKLFGALVAAAAVLGFVGIAWYATTQGKRDSSIVVPMIRADNSPVKVLPAKPGGMKVPNQDKLIFMQVTPGQKKPKVERLLPPPEKPMAKPVAPPKRAEAPPSGPMVPDTGAPVSRPASPQPRAPLRPEPAPSSVKALPKVPAAKPKPVKPAPKAAKAAKPVPKAAKAAKPVPKVKKSAKLEVAGRTPAAVPVPGAFQVQLGAVKTKVRAAKEAGRLARAHKSVLSPLTVKAVRVNLGKRGIFYRLRAGPLADRAAAAALCAKLKARNQGCIIVKP